MSAKLFTAEQKARITQAIRDAEKNTSGEVRVHIDKKCKADVLDRAAYLFGQLNIHKTKLRNGVLFYLATEDHKFAILGDAGINSVVPGHFWDDIKYLMTEHFKKGRFTEGLESGIKLAGEQLKKHFPYQLDDENELEDEISFGNGES